MFRKLGQQLRGQLVGLVALAVALGGTAYAATSGIPDSAGTFHACVNKRTGALRVIAAAKRCRMPRGTGKKAFPGEFAVRWNERGQPGQPGQRGPSDAYEGSIGGFTLPADVTGADLLSLSVPAGKYIFTFATPLQNFGTGGAQVTCATRDKDFFNSDNPFIKIGMGGAGMPADIQTPAMTGTFETLVPSTLSVQCYGGDGTDKTGVKSVENGARLTAIRVDAIHG